MPAARLIAATLVAAVAGALSAAEPTRPLLHPLFGDHAVLQHAQRIPVRGWADPGATVVVHLGERSAQAVAAADGRWTATFEPFEVGGPYTLSAECGLRREVAEDILFGDVWLCSGQSNMLWPTSQAVDAERELQSAAHPDIRLMTVPYRIALGPQSTLEAAWKPCDRDSAAGFSAVGYFFGRSLHDAVKVPIGLIQAAWGATVAEAWISDGALRRLPEFIPALDALAEQRRRTGSDQDEYQAAVEAWYRGNDPGTAAGWQDPGFDAASWPTLDLPRHWPGDFDGVMWFRRAVDLPPSWGGRDAVLRLGPIDDCDTTWVNGVRVGTTDRYDAPREYRVPAAAVQPGRNVIAVRVLDTGGPGGVWGVPADLQLTCVGEPPIALAGPWSYQAGIELQKANGPLPAQQSNGNPNVVTVVSNAMIEPLAGFPIKGAIWYQGESNASRAWQYRQLLPALIADWRARWGQGDFPFLVVQLANFTDPPTDPGESDWAELREAQLATAKATPACGLAVTIDIGEARDIHPHDKQEVGRRLALQARHLAYREDIACDGPRLQAVEPDGARLRLRFTAQGALALASGDKPAGFAIAGEDHAWAWADAALDGDSVLLSSPRVPKPVAARYAWATNPAGCNLTDASGLPASPFRTDDWPAVTLNNR